MMASESRVLGRAGQMRRDFDSAFAQPVEIDETITEKLLAVRVGGQPFAIRLSSIAGLFADKKITPVPGGHPALLGIAGFRGAVLPAYDLACLLGAPSGQSIRWLVIAKAAPVALAFEEFEAQLLVRPENILAQTAHADLKDFAREFVRSPTFSGPVLHLPSLLAAIGVSLSDAMLN